MTNEDFRVSEQPYCPREKVSKSITRDKLEVGAITLRLIEASVLEEVLEELEKNYAFKPIIVATSVTEAQVLIRNNGDDNE